MIVFYDPANSNQIMAGYAGDTSSTVWADAGYVRARVAAGVKATRDHRVTALEGDVVTATEPAENAVRPIPSPAPPDPMALIADELERLAGIMSSNGRADEADPVSKAAAIARAAAN